MKKRNNQGGGGGEKTGLGGERMAPWEKRPGPLLPPRKIGPDHYFPWGKKRPLHWHGTDMAQSPAPAQK